MLGLDDPRWGELRQAYGTAGNIPALLRSLANPEGRDSVWHDLWSALCHQGTAYSASFAAVPHIVALGATAHVDEQLDFWMFVGAVAVSSDSPGPPADLRAAYEAAVAEAERHALTWLGPGVHADSAASMLVAVAGLRRWPVIATVIEGLRTEELTRECPECETELFIVLDAPPFAVHDDDPVLTDGGKHTVLAPRPPRPELEDLAGVVERSGLDKLAAKVRALDSDITCPHCEHTSPILDPPP